MDCECKFFSGLAYKLDLIWFVFLDSLVSDTYVMVLDIRGSKY